MSDTIIDQLVAKRTAIVAELPDNQPDTEIITEYVDKAIAAAIDVFNQDYVWMFGEVDRIRSGSGDPGEDLVALYWDAVSTTDTVAE